VKKIKIFIGTLGMDQHELGAVVVASPLRDTGMEALYMGRFNLLPTRDERHAHSCQ
jgi:methylmalonyl-CoA mutase cobalamin-binding subunit